jgi:hypothetical protein
MAMAIEVPLPGRKSLLLLFFRKEDSSLNYCNDNNFPASHAILTIPLPPYRRAVEPIFAT